jgi:putative SOS response-associated peptidase YedK
MCYSAQVEAAYAAYRKMTGAEIDVHQFEEIFGLRLRDPSVRIPRAVELWFDKPTTPGEMRIRMLIDDYRSAEITKLEQELFALRKRLADAERKLEQKPTKAASESKRIATDKAAKAMKRLERLKDSKSHASDGRIFPMHYAPIVIQDDKKRVIRLARYHLRRQGELPFMDRKLPGLYNARRDSLGKYWKGQFGATHALMLVDSFYENVDRGRKNAVLHFVPKPAGIMLIACLHAEWTDPKGGERLISFAAITDEPPPEVAAAGHDRMIVNLKPENIDHWLSPVGRLLDELQAILTDRQAPYYEHEVMAA